MWWQQQKAGLAVDTREKLLKASLVLGVAAVTANRVAQKIGDWGAK